jgi:xylulokinase
VLFRSEALGQSLSDLDDLAVDAEPLDAPGLDESLSRRDPPALPDGPPGRVWATLLDALAASTEDAVSDVTGLLGERPRLVVFGGGAASRPWLAAKARRLPMPLWRSSAAEAVARGAALVAGVAAGWWASPDDAPPARIEPVDG